MSHLQPGAHFKGRFQGEIQCLTVLISHGPTILDQNAAFLMQIWLFLWTLVKSMLLKNCGAYDQKRPRHQKPGHSGQLASVYLD
ncbi:MAG: hypothetical protein KAJ52_04870 [Sedimentisphaerales bacterium]|nr:hypothetical protein [Sedimentisphaerales bacterium]